MALGNLAAFGGLSSGPDKNERVQRELGTLQQLSSMIEKERQEEMMFQEMEANQIEEIQKHAESLLERDRQKISAKAIQLGNNIKDEIGRYGSRKAFFANGGYAKLREYKNNILYSEEANRYKDNKINLERILKIQEAGKGALLAKQDLEALKRYENGEDVAITYSGMKSEVDIPEDAFQFGDNIPPGEILRHGNNYAAIYGNWLLENPHLEGLSGDELNMNLLAYTQANYSGIGKDKTRLQMQMAQNRARAERNTAKGLNDDGSPKTMDYSVELYNFIKNYSNQIVPDASNILATAGDDNNPGVYTNYFDKLRETGNGAEFLIGNSSQNYTDFARNYGSGSQSFLDAVGSNMSGKWFQPASAIKLAPGANPQFIKSYYEETGTPITNGYLNVNITSDGTYLKANGQKINREDVENQNDFTARIRSGEYSPGTAFVGFMDSNGEMITNEVDKKGNIDRKGQEERLKKWKDSDGKASNAIFIPLTKKDSGEVIYQVIPMDNAVAMTALNNAMGKNSNIAPVSKQVGANQLELEAAESAQLKDINQVKSEYNKSYTQQGLASPYIMEEQKMFQGESGNRNNMIQSYYMAANHLQNGSFKSESFISSGLANSTQFTKNISMFPRLQKNLLNYAMNDENAIDEIVKVLSAETDDPNDSRYIDYKNQPDYEYNLRLGEMMKSYLRILTGKK